jgi:ribose transport system ATP-binding protein
MTDSADTPVDGPPLLTLTEVVKTFPGVRALDGVELTVRQGEVHCLLGQNGAGKSTLIKVLSGAHRPDAGQITWQGCPCPSPTRRPPCGRASPPSTRSWISYPT